MSEDLHNRTDNIENKIDEISRYIKEETPSIDQMKLSNRILVEEVIEKCDQRYASKETEETLRKVLWGLIGGVFTIITGVAVLIVSVFIK